MSGTAGTVVGAQAVRAASVALAAYVVGQVLTCTTKNVFNLMLCQHSLKAAMAVGNHKDRWLCLIKSVAHFQQMVSLIVGTGADSGVASAAIVVLIRTFQVRVVCAADTVGMPKPQSVMVSHLDTFPITFAGHLCRLFMKNHDHLSAE